MCRGNPRTLGTRANFASTPLVGGSQPATESADGQPGRDHALLGVHRRGGSTVRRRDNECVARAVRELGVSRTFVTAQGRVLSFSRARARAREKCHLAERATFPLTCASRFDVKRTQKKTFSAARAAALFSYALPRHTNKEKRAFRDETRQVFLFTHRYDYASHPESFRLLPPPPRRQARTRARRPLSPPGPKTPATASTGSPRLRPRKRATPRTRRRCEVWPCARS